MRSNKTFQKTLHWHVLYALTGVGILLCALSVAGCEKKSDLEKVRVNEVAHSIFYAPQYAAMELGYFEEEGIDLELDCGYGADKTTTAILSGEADIAFMGPEATIYLYNEGNKDYLVNFAQLTQRAGNFVISREKNDEFQWEDLKGKEVIGGRKGGMPQMVFEYVLKLHGIDPDQDLTLVQNIDFANTSGAFIGGTGDYTVEFEPAATLIEQQKAGYVVASLGEESGYVPYTAYSAAKSYLTEHKDLLKRFTKAVQKGQEYVSSHTPEEVAQVIAPQFTDTDEKTIAAIVKRYADQDSYKEEPTFSEDGFTLLQDILESAGELEKRVDYETLVTTEFIGE